MSLPKGYKRLEYIQSSGTQYTDSLFKPNQNTRVVMDCELITGANNMTAFGAWTSSKNNALIYIALTDKTRGYMYYGTQEGYVSMNAGGRHTVDANKNVWSIDGTVVYTFTAQTFSCSYPLMLFAYNSGGTANQHATMILYSCQIYDNGTLVRDYIPCRNANSEIGLWDAVNEVFYGNAGTGTFTAGPVVPETVDESEITELEYIKTTGLEHVNTGIIPSNNTHVDMDFEILSTTVIPCVLFGSRSSSGGSPYYGVVITVSGVRSDYGSNQATVQPSSLYERTFIVKNKNAFAFGSSVATNTANTFTCAASMYLFAYNNGDVKADSPVTGIFYGAQVYEGNSCVREFSPARLSNGEVGLYDYANGKFYRNAGTGAFIAGPELVIALDPPAKVEQIVNVKLAWTAVSNATSYKIYRDGVFLAQITDTVFVDESAELGQTYVYGITACRKTFESEPTELKVYTREGYAVIRPVVTSANFL